MKTERLNFSKTWDHWSWRTADRWSDWLRLQHCFCFLTFIKWLWCKCYLHLRWLRLSRHQLRCKRQEFLAL